MKGRVLFVRLLLAGVSSMLPAWALESPTWVVDPAAPGDHLPPVGGSLFDALFAGTRDGRVTHMLPFPFEKLLARVDAQLIGDPASLLPPAKRWPCRRSANSRPWGLPNLAFRPRKKHRAWPAASNFHPPPPAPRPPRC